MPNSNIPTSLLTDQVDLPKSLPDEVGEQVWIEVIQMMDTIYADLVQHQVELEEKNTALEQTYHQLHQAHEKLKTTQQQLIQSEKMASLGRLVAGVAHELNNPISFILGNTHAFESYSRRLQHFFTELDKIDTPHIRTLRKQARIDKLLVDLDPLVEGTNEGAQRVSDIVGNLLRFTTPQQRNAESYDLVHLVNTAVQWVLRASTLKPTLHLDLPPELMIHGQEGLAHQILVNLLHNAIDACESTDSPTLWIKLEYDAEQVSIHIRDNGIGIKPSHLNTIFDPFFTTKESGKGTGLGLYISYLLATEQCGGALTAENHPEGGALFCLSLPLTIHDMTVEVQDD